MKLIKWLLAIALTLCVSLVLYITLLFDVNAFKPELIELVKKQTGRELQIKQDLSWSFFPKLGIDLGGIILSNPQGFKTDEMIKVKGVVASVALKPLFSNKVQIEQLLLDGVEINLVTTQDGRSSLDGLVAENAPNRAPEVTQESLSKGSGQFTMDELSIGGVRVTNAKVNIINLAQDSLTTLNLKEFTLGKFSLGQASQLQYEFEMAANINVSSQGKGLLTVSSDLSKLSIDGLDIKTTMSGDALPETINTAMIGALSLDINRQALQLTLDKLSAQDFSGSADIGVNYANPIPKINLSLVLDEMDLDPYLPAEEGDPATDIHESSTTVAALEPDLSALKTLDVNLKVKIAAIKAAKLKTENWQIAMKVKNGKLTIKEFSLDLYQGKMNLTASLDANQTIARYQFEQSLKDVQIRPLLMDAAELEVLSGTANFSMAGTGQSLIPTKLKQNLVADGAFEVADGALYGVNIPQMLRTAQAKLSGELSAVDTQELKTDFSRLTGSFNIKEASVTNPDLAISAPLLRIAGAGSLDIISQAIDYKLTTRVVGSLAGQEEQANPLKGLDIPLKIYGTVQEPEYGLDTSGLLDAKLKQETEKVKEKVKDKLKDGLLKRLGDL
ncbi:AsmA [Shewanella denitrificans OS217]|uniref:AsmA n=1 Tax=Shewanella denitrificans (strain OS217 / ATCC BAA-1090 / DSM 15013) TaxID=318161 RepID=Q12ML9_SHEDO|nr:AsmA family protein [Shewanella denitrificans]ABE55307.1 AsmA [Shewanella denitrificans OS217]